MCMHAEGTTHDPNISSRPHAVPHDLTEPRDGLDGCPRSPWTTIPRPHKASLCHITATVTTLYTPTLNQQSHRHPTTMQSTPQPHLSWWVRLLTTAPSEPTSTQMSPPRPAPRATTASNICQNV